MNLGHSAKLCRQEGGGGGAGAGEWPRGSPEGAPRDPPTPDSNTPAWPPCSGRGGGWGGRVLSWRGTGRKKLLGGLVKREEGIAGLQGPASGHWAPRRARQCPLVLGAAQGLPPPPPGGNLCWCHHPGSSHRETGPWRAEGPPPRYLRSSLPTPTPQECLRGAFTTRHETLLAKPNLASLRPGARGLCRSCLLICRAGLTPTPWGHG